MIDKKYYKGKTESTSIQMLRFFITGASAVVIDMFLLYFFTEKINIYYLLSAAFSFTIAMTWNYAWCIRWVFSKRKITKVWLEYLLFAITGLVGLAINEFFIWFFTEHLGIYYMYSKLYTLVFVFFYSFYVRKYLLFG